MYSDSDVSRPSESKPPEKRRSFLQPPKSYVSKLPGPTVTNPFQKTSPVEVEVPKTSPIPIPQPSPPKSTITEPVEPQEFFIGDRITIGGIKTGTLLYFGAVHIAPGLWCGIALDEKDGTHDGLVNDVRYFTCRNGHGIFAPVERVAHLDHKAIQKIVKSPPKVSHIPSKPSLSQVSPIRDEISFSDRSAELLDDCDNDIDDDILGLDENGIIQDDEDFEEQIIQQEKPRTRRKLPAPPRPSSRNYSSSKLKYSSRQESESLSRGTNESSMDESGGEKSQMSASDGDDTDLDVHELQHSATGSSGGEDSWSLNKDYIAMCDGKAQYLNITFDGESESKTSTQEPSEESPSPEFIFDQEMIEDGEFAAEPMEISRDASLGLISSFTLDNNDLMNDLFGNEEEEDFDNGTSQGTLEPMSEEKDGTPEKQDLNMSVEFDDNDLAASTPFQDCKLDLRNKFNVNETFNLDDANNSEIIDNNGLNVTFTKEIESDDKMLMNTTRTLQSEHVDGKSAVKNLNSTFTVDEKCEVEKISAEISAIAGKDDNVPVSMVDSGISMRGSMSDSAACVRNTMADSVRNSMADSGVSLKGSMIDPSIRRSMLDSGISVHSAMMDSNTVLQKSVQLPKDIGKEKCDESGVEDIVGNKDVGVNDVIAKSETDGLEKGLIHKDMDDTKLIRDLTSGHERKERPVSFLSTTSADTGYVPDTDSEIGTLTLNSPQEWMDKGFNGHISEHSNNVPGHILHDLKRDSPRLVPIPIESDSDFGTMTADTDNEADRIESLKSESNIMDNIVESCESEDEITQVEDIKNTTITKESKDSEMSETVGEKKDLDSTFTVDSADTTNETVEADDEKNESNESIPIVNISIEDKGTDKSEEKIETNKQKSEKQKPQKKKKFNVVKDFKKPNTTNVVSKLSEYLNTPVPVKPREEKSPKDEGNKSVLKEFKKPNTTNVVSKLSEYLKAPVPTKPREDKANTEEAKNKRNSLKGKIDFSKVQSKIGNKSVIEENKKVNGEVEKKEVEVVEKEPVKKVKRTPPKSKWDAIMSQIDNKKEQEKVKPKSEVKSKLEALLHAPPPAVVKKEEPKPKPKRRISSAIPDYSKVQSKLKYTAPPAKPKEEESPGKTKNEVNEKKRSITDSPKRKPSVSKNSSPARPSRTSSPSIKSRDTTPSRDKENLDRGRKLSKGLTIMNDRVRNLSGDSVKRPEIRDKAVHLDLADSLDGRGSFTGTGSVLSSRQSSQTDMSTTEDDPYVMKQLPQIERTLSLQDRRDSSSAMSEISEIGSQATAEEIELIRQKASSNQYRRKSSLPHPNDYQNRNKTSKSKKESKDKNKQPETVLADVHTKEVQRLEALCESRTKQLNIVKMQLQSSNVAFDGMASVVNYLANDLDGFSCPTFVRKTEKYLEEICEYKTQILSLESQKISLEEIVGQLKQQHKEYLNSLEIETGKSLQYQEETLSRRHKEALSILREKKNLEIYELKANNENHLARIQHEHAVAMQNIKSQHEEAIKSLQRKQENQMEELHKQHQDKLEDITGRFDSIKLTLSEKVETLKNECDRLRDRARHCEEALQRDSDYKVQCALAPYKDLPQEIESLKMVVEMRNEEINKLRSNNTELRKKLEELPIAQEKIISLQQKKENLEAIISMKTDHEKVLHERCQSLMRKYDKESRANKRLSMEYEELMWKLSESFSETDLGSQEALFYQKLGMSPTGSGEPSSPVPSRKLRTPSGSESSPSKSPGYRRTLSSSVDDREEKKLKRRSGNYLLDERKHRPTSPLARQDNPLTKSWSPSSQSPSPSHTGSRRSANKMSQSWCVDMENLDEPVENVSKIPRSQSSMEKGLRKRIVTNDTESGDNSDSEKVFVSNDDSKSSPRLNESGFSESLRSNGVSENEEEPTSSKPRIRRDTITLSENSDVFNDESSVPVSEHVPSHNDSEINQAQPLDNSNSKIPTNEIADRNITVPVLQVDDSDKKDKKSPGKSHTETTV
ncbi:Microtubule-associated tumor suppressor candidate 2 [Mactra antiquata]